MEAGAAQSLRSLVHDCLAKHMYEAAAFFADKMVSLSGYAPAEVYTLAQAFYCARQFRRCLQLLRGTELIEKDVRFRFLAARWGGGGRRGRPAAACQQRMHCQRCGTQQSWPPSGCALCLHGPSHP